MPARAALAGSWNQALEPGLTPSDPGIGQRGLTSIVTARPDPSSCTCFLVSASLCSLWMYHLLLTQFSPCSPRRAFRSCALRKSTSLGSSGLGQFLEVGFMVRVRVQRWDPCMSEAAPGRVLSLVLSGQLCESLVLRLTHIVLWQSCFFLTGKLHAPSSCATWKLTWAQRARVT